MNKVNFSARISPARNRKAAVFNAKHGTSNVDIVNEAIDNLSLERLKPALDATRANPRRRKP